ncbi:RNA-binding motif protein, X-linked 2 [Culicoides brevitarsis]|uniref:RNA-binding motif protein, X-linked 2 n=1 Tax=Culicoides brevitarsis TaxID=469753 RepID=UPI00307B8299
MNPLTNMKNVTKLSEMELKRATKSSWHDQYRDSAWIFVGGLPYDLTEGDIICVFSQYGEIVNINLVRDKKTGKQKGFCFICYEDQRSTILAVDNLNGIKICGRSIRVDHVAEYKVPKENEKQDEETIRLQNEGCAPKAQIPEELIKKEKFDDKDRKVREGTAFDGTFDDGFRLPMRLPIGTKVKTEVKTEIKDERDREIRQKIKKEKKSKKSKKEKKEKKKKHRRRSSSRSSSSSRSD